MTRNGLKICSIVLVVVIFVTVYLLVGLKVKENFDHIGQTLRQSLEQIK